MNVSMAAELMLDDLDSLQDSPVAEELADRQETRSYKFTSVN